MKKINLGRRSVLIFGLFLFLVLFSSYRGPLSPVPVKAESSETLEGATTPWSSEGLFPERDKFDPSREITDLRTESSKTFDNGDGSRTVAIGMGGPVHYQDPVTGKFKDINREVQSKPQLPLSARMKSKKGGPLRPIEKEIYAHANEDNVLRSYFKGRSKQGNLLRVETDVFFLTWQPSAMKWIDAAGNEELIAETDDIPAEVKGGKVVYKDIFPSVDEEFEILTGGVKDNIILSVPPSPPSGLGPGANLVVEGTLLLSAGLQVFVNGEEQVGYFETSSVIELRDETGGLAVVVMPVRVSDDAGAETAEAFYTWDLEAGAFHFTIEVPAEWVLAAERQYPVVIDPTVDIAFSSDTFISDDNNTENFSGNDQVYVGYDGNDAGDDWYRMYGLYKNSSALGIDSCIPNANITEATFFVYINSVAGSGVAIKPYRISGPSNWNPGTVTFDWAWANMTFPDDSNPWQDSGNLTGWYGYSVLNSVRNWKNGSAFYGILLYHILTSGGNNYLRIDDGSAYLHVVYTEECTPGTACCNSSGCYLSSGAECDSTDICAGDSWCTHTDCNATGSCNVPHGCTDCGNKDCDPLDTTCRNYSDVNIGCAGGACTNPPCDAWVDAAATTVCNTLECDQNDSTCRDYHDVNGYCNSGTCIPASVCNSYTDASNTTVCSGLDCDPQDTQCRDFHDMVGLCSSGTCLAPTTCTSYTDQPIGAACGTNVDCDYLDNACGDWHDNQGYCLIGSCIPPGTSCANYTALLPNLFPCGNEDCDYLDTVCRDYDDRTNLCISGTCSLFPCDQFTNAPVTTECGPKDCDYLDTPCRDYQDVTRHCNGTGGCDDPPCNTFVNTPRDTSCGTCRICDGLGACQFSSNETECGLCKFCDGAGGCNRTPPDDSACGVIDCDFRDTLCRDYQDLTFNRCYNFGNCINPGNPLFGGVAACDVYVNLPTTAPCGTLDCDYKDDECKNYNDAAILCDGAGACLASGATCATVPAAYSPSGAACTTCAGTAGCQCNGSGACVNIIPSCVADSDCEDLNVCTDDVCVNPNTPSSQCTYVYNNAACGTKDCNLVATCREYLPVSLYCSNGSCQDQPCDLINYDLAGTTCDDGGGQVCDGAGACIGCIDELDCDDGLPCTLDGCSTQSCYHRNLPFGAACPGGACDELGVCQAGANPSGGGGGGTVNSCGCMVRPGQPADQSWPSAVLYLLPLAMAVGLRLKKRRTARRTGRGPA